MRERTEAEMLHRMAAYCSSAERCRQDVEKKLSSSGLPGDVTSRIIQRLKDEKFLDDSRFARSFVNDKLRFNKWGRVKIAYELKKKDISPSLIEDAMSAIDESLYNEILVSLLKAKKKVTKGGSDRDINQKLLRFIIGRGFTSREAFSALNQLGSASSLDDYEITDDME